MLTDTQVVTGGSTAETWGCTFDNLFKNSGGEEILYHASVTSDLNAHLPEGSYAYTWVGNLLDITISHNRTVKDIPVTVHWDDDSDRDGLRPESVIVQLYADGQKVDGLEYAHVLSGNNETNVWNYTFEDLPMYRDGDSGEEILYTIGVDEAVKDSVYGNYTYTVEGQSHTIVKYAASYMNASGKMTSSLSSSAHAFVQLTHVPARADRTVTIHWDDELNRDAQRPGSVTVAVSAYQWNANTAKWEEVIVDTQVVTNGTTAAEWSCVLDDMLVNTNGEPILYKAYVISDLNTHVPEGGYDYTWVSAELDITISHQRNVKELPVTVQWNDDNDRDGLRPESIIVQLYADGQKMEGLEYAHVLNGANTTNTWTYTFKNLPRYRDGDSGEEILYTIGVDEVVKDSVYGNYTYTVEGQGHTIVKYAASYMNASGSDTASLSNSAHPFIKLTHIPARADRTVTIHWDDELNRDAQRADSVTVALYAYQWNAETAKWEEVLVDTHVMTGDATAPEWSYVFKDILVNTNGKAITYKAYVTSDLNAHVPEGGYEYTWVSTELEITISHQRNVKDLPVTIQWNDDDDRDGLRPKSIIVQLYADGQKMEALQYAHVLNGENTTNAWTYTFEDLPRYRNGESGEEILYTIGVDEVVKDSVYGNYTYTVEGQDHTIVKYTASYMDESGNDTDQLNNSAHAFIKLTHIPARADRTVTIHWDDELNRDAQRTDSVTVALYAYQWNAETAKWEEMLVDTQDITGGATAAEWSHVFDDILVNADGEQIIYKAYVTSDLNVHVPEGSYEYTWVSNQLEIIISHNRNVKNLPVTVHWSDDSDRDSLRPKGVIVQLYADGEKMEGLEYAFVLNGTNKTNTWTHTFENLPRHRNGESGEEILYTIDVEEIVEGSVYGDFAYTVEDKNHTIPKYTASYMDVDGNMTENLKDSAHAFIELTHVPARADRTVTIYWDDELNRDAQRVSEVTVTLAAYQWNAHTSKWEEMLVDTQVITGGMTDPEWSYVFKDELVYADGKEIIYKAYVTSDLNPRVPEGGYEYTWVSNQLDIIISHQRNVKDLPITVHWDDDTDRDSVRPRSIVVQLYADGERMEGYESSFVLNGTKQSNTWTHTFKNLPKYRLGESGTEILYTIDVEEVIEGSVYGTYTTTVNGEQVTNVKYTSSYMDANGNDTSNLSESAFPFIRLTHVLERVDQIVTIYWDDELNRDGIRPPQVTVTLSAYQWNDSTYRWEEVLVDTQVVTGGPVDATWTCTFPQQLVNHDGQEILYMASVSSDLNAHLPEHSYEYTWVRNLLDITISHNRNVKDLPVTVHWDDHNNNDTIRPKSIILQLYGDGVKMETVDLRYAYVLSGDDTANTWTYTFTDLPKYRAGESGVQILYTIDVEETVKDSLYGTYITTANGEQQRLTKYTASYMDDSGNTTSELSESHYPYIRLTHPIDQGTVNLNISWHDEKDRDGKRPSSVLVDLYKQVEGVREFISTVTVTAGDNNSWVYTISKLPLFEEGREITYLAEVSEDYRQQLKEIGYTVSIEGPVVHMYYTPEQGSVSTQIYWTDNDNNDNIRPDTVKATLMLNGESTGKTLDLNAENHWTATWNNLDACYIDENNRSQKVIYSVVVDVPDGYAVQYTPETTTTVDPKLIYVNLSHSTNLIPVDAKVYWNDNGNSDGVRPKQVELQLLANGEVVPGKILTLTEADQISDSCWAGVFENMPDYANGEKIYYTVQANDDVTGTYSPMVAGTTIYFSYKPIMADLYLSFQFKDNNNNADNARPTTVYTQLTANGVKVEGPDYEDTIYFEADGTANIFVHSLPVYESKGTRISYNVKVTFVDGGEGYTTSTTRDIQLSPNNANQLVVTLTKEADIGTETGHIYWFDCNNQRGNRPDTLFLNVYNDISSNIVNYTVDSVSGNVTNERGEVVGSVTISEWGNTGNASCWTYTINGLVQNAIYNGESKPIYYWATARDTGLIPWYTTVDGERNGLDVLLTHVNYLDDVGSSMQNFDVTVTWLDNNNAWNYRPNTVGIDLTLYANGDPYKTIHLTQADLLTGNDNAWTYSFKNLPTYLDGNAVVWTVSPSDVECYRVETLNYPDYGVVTYEQAVTFDFDIFFDDSYDDDAVRPDQLVLGIFADGSQNAVSHVTFTQPEAPAFSSEALADEIKAHWSGVSVQLPVWRRGETGNAIVYTFQWDDASATLLKNTEYNARPTLNKEDVESNTWYYLSANTWGDVNDTGLDWKTHAYHWETTLERDKETKTVYAEIIFDDDTNRDGLRPENVLIQMLANGSPVGEPVTVTGDSTAPNWTVSWPEMDVYEDGKTIEYTIQLVNVPGGYDMTIDPTGTVITLTHVPVRISATGSVTWNDSSELHYVYNSLGELLHTYNQVERTDVYVQLLANGEPYDVPVKIPATWYGEGETLTGTATKTWEDLYQFQGEGQAIEYTFRVYSDDLSRLLNDGHSLTYDFTTAYQPKATISHDLYDVRGTVYYLYNTDDTFLLKGIPVTVYQYHPETKTYASVGSAVTDENGRFEILNMPQGLLVVRATYQYGDFVYAGSVGVNLDRHDGECELIVNRDASGDSDLYRYRAIGNAYYQTDITDDSTITPVPEGSIVLLYKVINGETDVQYIGMTTTDANGGYEFKDLESTQYMVNVVFNYNGGTYTYDNADAVADGLTFHIAGADMTWPDIIKQVNDVVDPGPGPIDPGPDDPPKPDLPEPCVVSGYVYFSDNGVHTTDPVEGVDVYIYTASNNAELGHTMTDENGFWTIDGLPAQDYIAVFSYQGNASRVLLFTITEEDYELGEYTAATQYFDRNTKAPTATIRGVVLNEQGTRMSALVQIVNMDGEVIDFAYTNKEGFYEFSVPAGTMYQVRILEVDTTRETLPAGDPDDALTTLDYYTISGNFTVDGEPQSGCIVAVYKQNNDLDFDLVTATLTDGNGDYLVKLMENGNYKVVTYRNGQIYSEHFTTVGYQEWEPHVTDNGDGTYTISGWESFDNLILYDRTTSTTKQVKELGKGDSYSIIVPAGSYDLRLVKDRVTEKHYYIDCPDNVIDVTYYMTISGDVLNESGKPVVGAIVGVYDSEGQQVGSNTVITNGHYAYENLPEGTYEVRIDYPVAGDVLADKTTEDIDSYGNSYPGGMPDNSVWSWNINAVTVSGSVTDQHGNPIPGAAVVIQDNNDPDKAYATVTDENGEWSVGVKNGDYTVDAMYEADADHIYHAAEPKQITVDGVDVDNVDFVINRFALTGTVVREGDEQPLKDAEITVTYSDGTPI